MPYLRPSVGEVDFVVYDRPIHPEFFETLVLREVSREGFTLRVRMTPAGHVLHWQARDLCILEMIAGSQTELPPRPIFRQKVRGTTTKKFSFHRATYYCSMHEEILPTEQFHAVVQEFQGDAQKRGMIFYYEPKGPIATSPMGLVVVELLTVGLSIATFHSYPDESALIKTQSLIEIA